MSPRARTGCCKQATQSMLQLRLIRMLRVSMVIAHSRARIGETRMYEDSGLTDAVADGLRAEPSTAQAVGTRPADVSSFRRQGRRAIRTFVLAIGFFVLG